jgi:hypothetical protein
MVNGTAQFLSGMNVAIAKGLGGIGCLDDTKKGEDVLKEGESASVWINLSA